MPLPAASFFWWTGGILETKRSKSFSSSSPLTMVASSPNFTIIQHLQSAQIDTVSRVTISTIQRLYSMLQGKELDPELDEVSGEAIASIFKDPLPVTYNQKVPIETFDFIVTDECHRSIYNLWR
jgi:type I site-specific restriction endonuclease